MEQSLVDIICETSGKQGYADCLAFRNAMLQIRFRKLSHEDIERLKEVYLRSMDPYSRNQILIALVMQTDDSLKGFFRKSFFNESQLSFKTIAMRGYAQYATEEEIVPMMDHLMKRIAGIGESTPYDCEQFMVMKSEFCLPYLIETYGYDCFYRTLEVVEEYYRSMPEPYKGLFAQDEYGQYVPLLNRQELSARISRMMLDIQKEKEKE